MVASRKMKDFLPNIYWANFVGFDEYYQPLQFLSMSTN